MNRFTAYISYFLTGIGLGMIFYPIYWAFEDIRNLIYVPLGILITAIAFWIYWKCDE